MTDDLASSLASLIEKFGRDAVQDEFKRQCKGQRGRPAVRRSKHMDSDAFFVWLAVEQYLHLHPKASADQACDKLAGTVTILKSRDQDRPLSSGTLKNLYYEGKKAIAADPSLEKAWKRQLDTRLGREPEPSGRRLVPPPSL